MFHVSWEKTIHTLLDLTHFPINQLSIENIDVMLRSEIKEAKGKDKLSSVVVYNKDTKESQSLDGTAIFVFIGALPRTDFITELIKCDRSGFIVTGPDLMSNGSRPKGWKLKRDPYLLETSIPGIFAAGDVRHGSIKRVATAIGEGSASLQSIHRYLSTV